MKFILLFDWTYINVDEIQKIQCEEKDNREYSYFILKNGEKHDGYDCPDFFGIDDDKEYIFCCKCHQMMNKILLNEILDFTGNIYDIELNEERLWEIFLAKCRQNLDKLKLKPKFICQL